MANYLATDTDLTSVANAIRAKGGTSASLSFPAGFVSAIDAISGGDTVYQTPNTGTYYVADTVVNFVTDLNYVAWRIKASLSAFLFYKATEMETCEIHVPAETVLALDNSVAYLFFGCTKLRSVIIDAAISSLSGSSIFSGCTALEYVQFGGLGKPDSGLYAHNSQFSTCTALTDIVIYVDAATLADIPSNITSGAPFGAVNASVTYKNSTTGEVISA